MFEKVSLKRTLFIAFSSLIPWSFAAATPSEWPFGKGEAEGLLWFWKDQTEIHEILDEDGDWVRDGEALLRENAYLDRHFAAVTHSGFLEAPDLGPGVASSLENFPDLVIEMGLHPDREFEPEGTLFWMGTFSNDLIMKLVLEEQRLTLQLPETKITLPGQLVVDESRHLIVHLSSGSVDWWVDGQPQQAKEAEPLPVIDDPWDIVVTYGGVPEARESWQGSMNFLALRRQLHSPEEVYSAWREDVDSREAVALTIVEARLVEAAEEPNPSEISEYGEGIFASVWEVTRAKQGDFSPGDQLLTWNWYVLDRMVVAEGRPPEEGAVKTLHLSPFEANPQVQEVQQIDTGLDPVALLDFPSFFVERRQSP